MEQHDDVVVLVHGLAAHRLMLRPLATYLQNFGFRTVNFGYPSIRHTIEHHAKSLRNRLHELEGDPTVQKIRLVTHSMGGIVARASILDSSLSKLTSLVMLAPPNRGSRVATNLGHVLGWMCTPLKQLADNPDSLVNQLPPPSGVNVGILAAQYDRVVAVDSTRLSCEHEHDVVPSGHNSMLFRRDVAHQVAAFLHQGCFTGGWIGESCSLCR